MYDDDEVWFFLACLAIAAVIAILGVNCVNLDEKNHDLHKQIQKSNYQLKKVEQKQKELLEIINKHHITIKVN